MPCRIPDDVLDGELSHRRRLRLRSDGDGVAPHLGPADADDENLLLRRHRHAQRTGDDLLRVRRKVQ